MPECYAIKEGVIYTVTVPFQDKDRLKIYKSGVNVFYFSAHRTTIQDRRIPGVILFFFNATGNFMRLAI